MSVESLRSGSSKVLDAGPHRLGIEDYLRAVSAAAPARLRRVPARAISGEDEESSCVACPCGARPLGAPSLRRCPGCERYYVRSSDGTVLVAYGEMTPPT